MPEMMRWLWRDSTPVTTDPTDLGSRGYLPPAAGVPTQAAAVALRGYAAYEELLLDIETRGHTVSRLFQRQKGAGFCSSHTHAS
eukprot:COSAG06_NODE_1352_length_9757_cov_3.878236_5_plen_84_part_00